ncbi:hypothetical protein DIPPA_22325 [Diplonema papillatum]|nr:hypothetical protein DIPPA_22325 [Diplonema papillatum]
MDKREERDATRRRKVEVDQALQQLEAALGVFDESIESTVLDDDADGQALKVWEPFTTLQKKRAAIEGLRRHSHAGEEELKVALSEIEDRIRLVRGLNARRCKTVHGPSADRDYRDARLWLNSVAIKLHVASSRIVRDSRKAKGNVILPTRGGGSKGKLGGVQMLSSKLDSDEEQTVARYQFHLHKVEKMRECLDRDKISAEDVLSIQADVDQHLGEVESGELDSSMDDVWDCIGVDLGGVAELAHADSFGAEHDGDHRDDEKDSAGGTPSKRAARKHRKHHQDLHHEHTTA